MKRQRTPLLLSGILSVVMLSSMQGNIHAFELLKQSRSDMSTSLFEKKWRLMEIRGMGVTTKAYIKFDNETRRYSGDGGCNGMSGVFELSGRQIRFSQGISSMRACQDRNIQKVENDFFKALEEVTRFQIEDDVLHLNPSDRALLTFRAEPADTSCPPTYACVTGTITYRERIALARDAFIEVNLLDVSRAGARPITIAQQTITPEGAQLPIAFTVPYEVKRIDPRGRYSIQVRILVGKRLRFTNTADYPVITGGHADQVNVVVKSISRK